MNEYNLNIFDQCQWYQVRQTINFAAFNIATHFSSADGLRAARNDGRRWTVDVLAVC